MNRCPSCRNLVPANWIACRRCGAALPPGSDDGQPLLRPASLSKSTATLTRTRGAAPVAARVPHIGQDTLVPRTSGARRDTLVPVHAKASARTVGRLSPVWQRRIAVGVAAVVVLGVARASWGMLNTPESIRDAQTTAAAVQALDRTVNVARTFFVRDGAYDTLDVAEFKGKTGDIVVVDAGTTARPGQVSVKGLRDATAVFATPGHGDICVFARHEPMQRRVVYATTTGEACRAANPPKDGWRSA